VGQISTDLVDYLPFKDMGIIETVTSMKQVSNQSFSKSKAALDRAVAVENLLCYCRSKIVLIVYFCIFPCHAYTWILIFVVACVRGIVVITDIAFQF